MTAVATGPISTIFVADTFNIEKEQNVLIPAELILFTVSCYEQQ